MVYSRVVYETIKWDRTGNYFLNFNMDNQIIHDR